MPATSLKSIKSIDRRVKICCVFGHDPASEVFIQNSLRTKYAVGAIHHHVSMHEFLKSSSHLIDYFRETGLFCEKSLLTITDAKDTLAKYLKEVEDTSIDQEKYLLILAPTIRKSSSILKFIDGRKDCLAISAYDIPITLSELDETISSDDLAQISSTSRKRIDSHLSSIDISASASFASKLSLLLKTANGDTDSMIEEFLTTEEQAIDDGLVELLLNGDIDHLINSTMRSVPLADDSTAALALATYQLLTIYLNRSGGRDGGKPMFWKLQRLIEDVQRRNSNLTAIIERSLVDITEHDRSTRSAQALSDIELQRLLIRLALRFSSARPSS